MTKGIIFTERDRLNGCTAEIVRRYNNDSLIVRIIEGNSYWSANELAEIKATELKPLKDL